MTDCTGRLVNPLPQVAGPDAYRTKSQEYFSGARLDYVSELSASSDARVLEIGCAYGETGALALNMGKCGSYCAVELSESAAALAKSKLTEVVVGNVEQITLPWEERSFDAMILSEVMEHLLDPWAVLQKLRPLMKPGAVVFSSSPNVSHHSVLRMLMRGDWTLQDSGLMDRTHLRWFTPKSYRELFESTGYVVDSVRALGGLGPKARLLNWLTFGQLHHLLTYQIDLRAHCS
ncbi:MAG TPA: class I SAM-dependent methyltransferase [Terriglobales bacterium]|nr:class I SAM-dependent methyltransferase [Terriglobales bacterium]